MVCVCAHRMKCGPTNNNSRYTRHYQRDFALIATSYLRSISISMHGVVCCLPEIFFAVDYVPIAVRGSI